MGYIQTLDHISVSCIYTNGFSADAEGSDLLDIAEGDTSYWYASPLKVASGTSSQVPPTGSAIEDSPNNTTSYRDTTQGTGYLMTLYMDIQAQTHLAVGGGYIPGGGPGVDGFPIALSSATWHLTGQAVNTVNQANPGGANQSTTLNMLNWSVQGASGPGPSPTPLAGASNAPWTSAGDGVIKYLSWSNNSASILSSYDTADGSANGASSNLTMPHALHGPARGDSLSSVYLADGTSSARPFDLGRWDRALALLVPTAIIPVPQVADDLAIPIHRKGNR